MGGEETGDGGTEGNRRRDGKGRQMTGRLRDRDTDGEIHGDVLWVFYTNSDKKRKSMIRQGKTRQTIQKKQTG